jgi:transposase
MPMRDLTAVSPVLPLESLSGIETKRRVDALVLYFVRRAESMSRGAAKARTAAFFDVSPRTLRRWIAAYKSVNSVAALLPKKRTGRPTSLDSPRVLQFMSMTAEKCGFEFTLEEMASWVKEEFGFGSRRAISILMKRQGWKRVRVSLFFFELSAHKNALLACRDR